MIPLVSEVACALWLPMWTNCEIEDRHDHEHRQIDWSRHSFSRFTDLDCTSGVKRILHHEFYTESESNAGLYLIREEEADFLPEFDEGPASNPPPMPLDMQPLVYRQSFLTYVITMPIYLSWLKSRFITLGGEFETGAFFDTFEDAMRIEADLYINALGLGASRIVSDTKLKGVKGQVLLASPRRDIKCSVGAGEFCMIPRDDALVLGSLFQEDFCDAMPTTDNTDRILQVVCPWMNFPRFRNSLDDLACDTTSLKTAGFRALAGLRPFRSAGIRVELEERDGRKIIHNYGHGGAGVSLSWGCAKTVVELSQTYDC